MIILLHPDLSIMEFNFAVRREMKKLEREILYLGRRRRPVTVLFRIDGQSERIFTAFQVPRRRKTDLRSVLVKAKKLLMKGHRVYIEIANNYELLKRFRSQLGRHGERGKYHWGGNLIVIREAATRPIKL